MLQYHHCTSLESVIFGELKASPEYSDLDFKGAYSWLEKEVGFYPLFLVVGTTEADIRMTGYQDNWRLRVSYRYENGKTKGTYRKAGEFPNLVLFSFEDVDGVFMDYAYWHIVLNANPDYKITNYEKRLIFKPSWSKSKWLRKAKKEPHSIQLVTPMLYLPNAARILVRNHQTKKLLEEIGFNNIEVRRILLNES